MLKRENCKPRGLPAKFRLWWEDLRRGREPWKPLTASVALGLAGTVQASCPVSFGEKKKKKE